MPHALKPNGAPRRRRFRLVLGLAVLLVCAAAAATARKYGFEFRPEHHARASAATLAPPLQKTVNDRLDAAAPANLDEAIAFALTVTDGAFFFGLSHPTKLAVNVGEREGNCIEYAHLFAAIFDLASRRASLHAKAYVVHSDNARLLGKKVPLRGWGDHDWVLIDDRSGQERRNVFVDPTLHDLGLGWDIASNVTGPVSIP